MVFRYATGVALKLALFHFRVTEISTEHISFPKAEKVFSAWMAEKGWAIQLSDKGRMAIQMLKQLGGIYGTGTIANYKTLMLLEKLSKGNAISEKKLKDELWKLLITK